MAWLKQNAYRIGIVLLLLIAGAFLALIDQRSSLVSQHSPIPEGDHGTPDQYLEQVVYTRYDDQGRPYQVLESPKISNYSQADESIADQPKLAMLDSNNRHWHATGDTGVVNQDNTHVVLKGNAQVTEPEQQWRLTTDILNYNRDQGRIWSDSESNFFQGQHKTSGDRFQAWTDTSRALLEGNISSTFMPRH